MIRLTNEQGKSNWDLFAEENGHIRSVAIVEGCDNSSFGTVNHLISMMYKYKAKYNFTPQGKAWVLSHCTKIQVQFLQSVWGCKI